MLFVASSFFRPFERAPLETGAIAGLRGLPNRHLVLRPSLYFFSISIFIDFYKKISSIYRALKYLMHILVLFSRGEKKEVFVHTRYRG